MDHPGMDARSFCGGSYPTTCVIDRYGVLCYKCGYQLFAEVYTRIYDHFTGSDYTESDLAFEITSVTLEDLGGTTDLDGEHVRIVPQVSGLKHLCCSEDGELALETDADVYQAPEGVDTVRVLVKIGADFNFLNADLFSSSQGIVKWGNLEYNGKDGFLWDLKAQEGDDLNTVSLEYTDGVSGSPLFMLLPWDASEETMSSFRDIQPDDLYFSADDAGFETEPEDEAGNETEPADETPDMSAASESPETQDYLIRIYCVDENDNELSGAMLALCAEQSCTMLISDIDGCCLAEGSWPSYRVHVLVAPAGYRFIDDEPAVSPGESVVLRFLEQ